MSDATVEARQLMYAVANASTAWIALGELRSACCRAGGPETYSWVFCARARAIDRDDVVPADGVSPLHPASQIDASTAARDRRTARAPPGGARRTRRSCAPGDASRSRRCRLR